MEEPAAEAVVTDEVEQVPSTWTTSGLGNVVPLPVTGMEPHPTFVIVPTDVSKTP